MANGVIVYLRRIYTFHTSCKQIPNKATFWLYIISRRMFGLLIRSWMLLAKSLVPLRGAYALLHAQITKF